MPRARPRARVLIIVVGVVVAIAAAAGVSDAILRSRIDSELAATESPVGLTLGTGSVLWSYLTGTLHVDAHLDPAQLRDAIGAKTGLAVGEITTSAGVVHAELGSGPVSALLGGDVALDLVPEAVNGELSISVAGMSIDGQQCDGAALADRIGPFTVASAEMMDCAALGDMVVDGVVVDDDGIVVSLAVPTSVAGDGAACR